MCYPCPWTVLLPLSPDRTLQLPNIGLQPAAANEVMSRRS